MIIKEIAFLLILTLVVVSISRQCEKTFSERQVMQAEKIKATNTIGKKTMERQLITATSGCLVEYKGGKIYVIWNVNPPNLIEIREVGARRGLSAIYEVAENSNRVICKDDKDYKEMAVRFINQ